MWTHKLRACCLLIAEMTEGDLSKVGIRAKILHMGNESYNLEEKKLVENEDKEIEQLIRI